MYNSGIIDLSAQNDFVTIPAKVLCDCRLSANEKVLLGILQLYKTPIRRQESLYACNLTQKQLMSLSGIKSNSTLTSALGHLEEYGAIRKILLTDTVGRKLGNMYVLADYKEGFKEIPELTEEELRLCVLGRS